MLVPYEFLSLEKYLNSFPTLNAEKDLDNSKNKYTIRTRVQKHLFFLESQDLVNS